MIPEWEGFFALCGELSAEWVPGLEQYLSDNFDCESTVVEKKRENRDGIELYPGQVIKIAFLGCCNQDDLPP
jgi:hypothetical protein